MKIKIVIISFLCIASLLCIQSCEQDDAKISSESIQDAVSVRKPNQVISLKKAHELYKAYQDNFRSKSNNPKLAYYGWHSIGFYKNYISYLEKESAKQSITVSGLRLYFAAYPENKAKYGKKAGYQTYMFLPTYLDTSKNTHTLYDPSLTNTKGAPIPIEPILKKGPNAYKNNTWYQKLSEPTAIANMGEMCPFNCSEEVSDEIEPNGGRSTHNITSTGSGKPYQLISLAQAHELYTAYQDNFMSKSIHDKMAYYGWHSIAFYKNYIAYIEQESTKKGIAVTGLRLYFVSYPEDPKQYGQRAGYQTYMFAPTFFDTKTNTHRPFDPQIVDTKGQPIPIEKILQHGPEHAKSEEWYQTINEANAIANMSQMCPLNCSDNEIDGD